ncbi:hypothetical protein SAMN05877753_105370 [Bacillus oleivorans]|uniref:Uncharacterized protein n=1 Tax=Bacillus oleivorans TaxID=1448271 RepID=A0A285CW27_9BACI|nr:hypothetical protein SAMN05877753_105370 [Bacillus oleivorans]
MKVTIVGTPNEERKKEALDIIVEHLLEEKEEEKEAS